MAALVRNEWDTALRSALTSGRARYPREKPLNWDEVASYLEARSDGFLRSVADEADRFLTALSTVRRILFVEMLFAIVGTVGVGAFLLLTQGAPSQPSFGWLVLAWTFVASVIGAGVTRSHNFAVMMVVVPNTRRVRGQLAQALKGPSSLLEEFESLARARREMAVTPMLAWQTIAQVRGMSEPFPGVQPG
jgi:hypothetical protein